MWKHTESVRDSTRFLAGPTPSPRDLPGGPREDRHDCRPCRPGPQEIGPCAMTADQAAATVTRTRTGAVHLRQTRARTSSRSSSATAPAGSPEASRRSSTTQPRESSPHPRRTQLSRQWTKESAREVNGRQNPSAAAMSSNRPGKPGWYFRVLNCASEKVCRR